MAGVSGGGAVVVVGYGSDDDGCDEGECDEEVGENLNHGDRETARSRRAFVMVLKVVAWHCGLCCGGRRCKTYIFYGVRM